MDIQTVPLDYSCPWSKVEGYRQKKGQRSSLLFGRGEEFFQFLAALTVLHWTIWIVGWIAPWWFERKGWIYPILQNCPRQNKFFPPNRSDDLCVLFCLYLSSMSWSQSRKDLQYFRAGNSLICSFAHFAQINWATVSDSLRSLKTNERLWAKRSGHSRQISDCERIAQVAHDKWATMSDLLRSLMINEQMSN